ncbi:MAG: DUF885 domain-containing protein [Solobacterium sp.]|nr:DUF885 domain-containing protein [Solobacterium sp.]MBR0213393.1 DUF885 domain-containing protein [Solobacterium sp.]
MKLWQKIPAFLMAVLLAMPAGIAVKAEEAGDPEFDDYLMEEWMDSMESDFLTMHYSVKDYRKYGIERPEATWGEVSYEDYAQAAEDARTTLAELETFDYDKLSPSQQTDYDTYKHYVENMLVMNEHPEFDEHFNPYNGTLSNLVTNLTEFVFYEKQDIDDYLTILADTPRLIDDMMAMTRQQASEGFFMNDATLDTAIEEIGDFTEKTDDSALIIIFEKNIDAFAGLTDAQKKEYKDRNRAIVLNQVIPAYEKAATDLESLRGCRNNPEGTAGYPNGKEYFTALARYKTSTNLTVEEMVAECEKALASSWEWAMNSISIYGFDENGRRRQIHSVQMKEPVEILEYLKAHLEDFPEGPAVNYTAEYLDPSVANPSTMAYYMTTPVDDITDNVIKINADIVGDDNTTLYYTLAHEGYPGHLYQFTWYLNTNPNPLRHDLSIMGYQEGWAQYVEGRMLAKSGLDEYSATIARADVFVGYVLNALADLGVNGLGWTVDELLAHIVDYGYSKDTAQALYDAVVEMPGTIIPYGYGMLEFYNQRDKAQQSLGDKFDEVAFHTVLLTGGPRPFELVAKDVDAYIVKAGGTPVKEYSAFTYDNAQLGEADSPWMDKLVRNILIAAAVVLVLLIVVIVMIVRHFRKKRRLRKAEEEKRRAAAEAALQKEVVAAAQEQRERLMGTYTPDEQTPEAPETDDADPGDSQE